MSFGPSELDKPSFVLGPLNRSSGLIFLSSSKLLPKKFHLKFKSFTTAPSSQRLEQSILVSEANIAESEGTRAASFVQPQQQQLYNPNNHNNHNNSNRTTATTSTVQKYDGKPTGLFLNWFLYWTSSC